MPTTKTAERPLHELSDRQLDARLKKDTKAFAALRAAPTPTSQELRAGVGERRLEEMRTIGKNIELANAEKNRRFEAKSNLHGLSDRLRARRTVESRAARPHPAAQALAKVRSFAHPELAGVKLDTGRLSEEEGKELVKLAKAKTEVSRGTPRAQPLSLKETRHYERLLGKLVGNEKLFAEKREEAQTRAKLADAKEELRLAALPQRPMWAEPGSVSVPRFVFEWLQSARQGRGEFSIADLGMLVALLGMFWNERSLFIGGEFTSEDGRPVLVIREDQLRFPPRLAGDPMTGEASGFVRERHGLKTLTRNKWFEIERSEGNLRIRLGERAKKLLAS